MPAYTFVCNNCNNLETVNLTLEEYDAKQHCKECNYVLRRIFTTNSSTLIKGNGFYQASKVR